jgi:hypothetical protein
MNQTRAESAHKLYSWVDSSAGEYTTVIDGFLEEDDEKYSEIVEMLQDANEHLDDAFEILDETILDPENVEFDGDGTAEFTSSVPEVEINSVNSHLREALSAVESSQKAVENRPEVISVTLGVHENATAALEYIHSDTEYMCELARNMQ